MPTKTPALPARSHIDLLGAEVAHKVVPSRAYVAHFFRSALKGKSVEEIANILTSDFRDAAEYLDLLGEGKTCQRMSLRFNPHRLSTGSHQDGKRAVKRPSIHEAMQSDRFFDGLARVYLAWYAKKENKTDLLYSMIQTGVQGSVYINEFPPHVARDIYREFRLGKSSRILDPCAGWGGRMIGASTVSDYYDACEPALATHRGLLMLGAHLHGLTGTFSPRVAYTPFEDTNFGENRYDFALTSPPYYDTEIYTDEANNSLNRYKTFAKWTKGFYVPFLEKTIRALKPGAYFVLNIGDRKYPLPKIAREWASANNIVVSRLNSRLATGGGLRTHGEGEIFLVLRKPQ